MQVGEVLWFGGHLVRLGVHHHGAVDEHDEDGVGEHETQELPRVPELL